MNAKPNQTKHGDGDPLQVSNVIHEAHILEAEVRTFEAAVVHECQVLLKAEEAEEKAEKDKKTSGDTPPPKK